MSVIIGKSRHAPPFRHRIIFDGHKKYKYYISRNSNKIRLNPDFQAATNAAIL